MYGLTLLAIRLMGFALDEYADREHLYAASDDDEERRERDSLLPVVAGVRDRDPHRARLPAYWQCGLYLGIAVYLVVPFREISAMLRARPFKPDGVPRASGDMRAREGIWLAKTTAPRHPCIQSG